MRLCGAFALVSALCALASCRSVAPLTVEERIASVSSERLERHIRALAAIGPHSVLQPDKLRQARDYIVGELEQCGLEPRLERFPLQLKSDGELPGWGEFEIDAEFENIVVTFPALRGEAPILEFGAHYDTVPESPGADDNSSGVAALLEIARAAAGLRGGRALRLCFYSAEEPGMYGSAAHVGNIINRREEVAGAVILDGIAYYSGEPGSQSSPVNVPGVSPPTVGDFIAIASDAQSGFLQSLFVASARRHSPQLKIYETPKLIGSFVDRSDHASYWSQGLRAILIADTAEFRNPHYHRAGDTPDTVDVAFAAEVTRAAAAVAVRWMRGPSGK